MRTNQKYFACTASTRGSGAGLRLRRQYRRRTTAAQRSSRATAGCSQRGSPTRASSGSRTSRSRSRSKRRSSTDRLSREARHGCRQGRARREACALAGREAASIKARRRRGRARGAAGQGRPRHRHGRRIPRAAGRDRRLSRRSAGRAGVRSPTRFAIITSRWGRAMTCRLLAVTVAVSLADKLDTHRAFFSVDQKPTGSKDPFALRRAAIASIELIIQQWLAAVADGGAARSLANRAGQVRRRSRVASARSDCDRVARLLRGSPEGPAARGRSPARSDRCGVFAGRRGRPRAACSRA